MKDTESLVKQLYPKVSTSLSKNTNKYRQVIARFIEKRSKDLYDIAPCSRIYFGEDDITDFYSSMGLNINDATKALQGTYYYNIANFNPRAAKDEFTVTLMMVIRYFYIKNMSKELDMAMIHLAFSGKFYPSIHYRSFPVTQPSEYRYIMEYVVNNKLSNKYDIKREGSLFKAILSICKTWLSSYGSRIKNSDDEDIVYLIQQLHTRIGSFMKNIATIYYEVYNNKDAYFVYDTDNASEDGYKVADNDSLKIERIVEKTMENIQSHAIDYKICKMAADSNVKTDEVKSIIESILNDKDNIGIIKELLRNIVSEYFVNGGTSTKDVRDIKFITFSLTPKPNTKNKNVIRQKEIIEQLLNENSTAYRRRRSREATKNSYHRSILAYFVILIHESNK